MELTEGDRIVFQGRECTVRAVSGDTVHLDADGERLSVKQAKLDALAEPVEAPAGAPNPVTWSQAELLAYADEHGVSGVDDSMSRVEIHHEIKDQLDL